MALTVVLTRKPVCKVPEGHGVEELYLEPPGPKRYKARPVPQPVLLAGRLPGFADRLFKRWDRQEAPPRREKALRMVEAWIVQHGEFRRELGRDPAALDLFAVCAQEPRLPARPPGCCERN